MSREPRRDPAPPATVDHGYFFVGGRAVEVGSGQAMTGQMFVEWRRPAAPHRPVPIVMVHGTAQTGTNFLGTPDGRPGWADDFVSFGYAVHVVDQVGRGRSGHFPEYGPTFRVKRDWVEQRFTNVADAALWPQARRHDQWPGGPGAPGNPAFDQFYASQVESVASGVDTERLNAPALEALLERIGPAIVLTHSQAGVFGWKLADARPDLVRAVVAVEPNGPPFRDVDFRGGADWYQDSADLTRPWGITRLPLTYDPPAADPSELRIEREAAPRAPDQVRCWLQADPPRQLPRLRGIPIAIVTAEASYRAACDGCTARFLAQAGVPNTHIRLAEHGLRGNGHMMMLENNSRDVAGVIAGWLDENVR